MTDQKKLRPRQVAAYQSLRPVMVDESATCGAQIGVNLLLPDGTVGTVAQLVKLFGSTATAGTGTLTTTDDLEEGQWNLWFTNRRAQDAVGGILANSANVTLAYVGGTSIIANLTPITFGGSGSLYAFTFDTYGRVVDYRTPATTDLAEGTNLYFTAARVLATVLAGLSTATNAIITAADTVLGALGKLQAQITDNLLPAGYIDGLKMVWVSGTALTVTSGAAYVPSLSKVLRVTSDIAKAGLSLTASTWYHVYLYSNAGTPDVEISTTAPAAPYNGTARTKTGDNSRRYIGSVLTDTSGNLINFIQFRNDVFFIAKVLGGGTIYRLVSSGTATTPTAISAASVVPATSRIAIVRLQNTDSTQNCFFASGDYSMVAGIDGQVSVAPGAAYVMPFPVSASQTLQYEFQSAPTGGVYVDVLGYTYER